MADLTFIPSGRDGRKAINGSFIIQNIERDNAVVFDTLWQGMRVVRTELKSTRTRIMSKF